MTVPSNDYTQCYRSKHPDQLSYDEWPDVATCMYRLALSSMSDELRVVENKLNIIRKNRFNLGEVDKEKKMEIDFARCLDPKNSVDAKIDCLHAAYQYGISQLLQREHLLKKESEELVTRLDQEIKKSKQLD
jgi:hypothetical protein